VTVTMTSGSDRIYIFNFIHHEMVAHKKKKKTTQTQLLTTQRTIRQSDSSLQIDESLN